MKYLYLYLIAFVLSFFNGLHAQSYLDEFQSVDEFVTLNGYSYFVAQNQIFGKELWKTDGTKKGTVILKDIFRGGNGSDPTNLFVFNEEVYFSATDGIHGHELWKTDGTAEGTNMVADIFPPLRVGSNPRDFKVFNNQLYFIARNESSNNFKLWRTDGTENGTMLIHQNPQGYGGNFVELTVANGKLYFVRKYGGNQLWESDGTSLGTKQILFDAYYNIAELNSFNGELYFITHTSYRQEIRFLKLDNTGDITLLKEFAQPQYGDIDIHNFTEVNNEVYFSITTDDDTNGDSDVLWKTNGTPQGTLPIKSFSWERHTSNSKISNFIDYKNELYFNSGSQNNYALWKSDGTEAGTIAAATNTRIDTYSNFKILNELLYFSSSATLWSSNGTEENTRQFSDLRLDRYLSNDIFFIETDGNLIYFNVDQNGATALYNTGTQPRLQIKSGSSVLAVNDILTFASKVDSVFKKEITIRNLGSSPLSFSKIQVTGGDFYLNGALFKNISQENPEGNFPRQIPPGGQSHFEISFYPAIEGFQKGQLTIYSNDDLTPIFTFEVNGFTLDGATENPLEPISLQKQITFQTTSLFMDNNSIIENSPSNSTIGVLGVLNSSENYTYELISGEGDADNALFFLDNNALKSSTTFDFEFQNTYSVRVKANNETTNISIEENIIISVVDENENTVSGTCAEEVFNMSFGLNDVDFINNDHVMAVGSHGEILKSYDGGLTWNQIKVDGTPHLGNIQFVNNEIGYIKGSRSMYKTEDSGESWFPLELPQIPYPHANNMVFTTPENGFIFGNDGILYKTTDGGRFWQKKSAGNDDYKAGYFINETTGFLCGDDAENLLKTTNSGESWEKFPISSEGVSYRGFVDIYFVNEQIGFLAGYEGEILKTVNGGNTWEVLADLAISVPTKIRFLDENTGYLLGGFNFPTLYKTDDGGQTWNPETFERFGTLTGMSFNANVSHSIIVGHGTGFGSTAESGSSIYHKGFNENWETISSLRGDQDNYAVHFSDEIGYVFGERDSKITEDGGKTWQALAVPEDGEIRQIERMGDIVFVLGKDNVHKSTDLGKTWITLGESSYFRKLFIVNSQMLYAASYGLGVFKSTDGGITWNRVYNTPFYAIDLHFKNELEGFVVGIDGMIHTDDGGQTWNQVTLELENGYAFLYSINFYNDDIGIAGSKSGVLYKTTDGGLTWDKLYTVMGQEVYFLNFTSDQEWFASSGGNTTLYKSTDGGLSWENQYYVGSEINDIHFDGSKMYAIGDRGTFIRIESESSPSKPGYISGRKLVSNETSESYSVLQNRNMNYSWEVSGDHEVISMNNRAEIKWNSVGTHRLSVTPFNNCQEGETMEIEVTVEESRSDPIIIGSADVEEFSFANDYYVDLRNDSRYQWFVEGESNLNTNLNTAQIDWGSLGSGLIEVIETSNVTGQRTKAQLPITINPTSDILLKTTDASCRGENNGMLEIQARTTGILYNATLDIGEENAFKEFDSSTSFENLSPGDYSLCIYTATEEKIECYEFSIGQPEDFEVSSKRSGKFLKSLNLEMSGGAKPYQVFLNGEKIVETVQNSVTIPVEHGDILEVFSTGACSFSYVENINLLGNFIVAPNPNYGMFSIYMPKGLSPNIALPVSIFTIKGKLVKSQLAHIANGQIAMDITNHPPGMYLVKIGDENPTTLKIIKR